MTAHAAQSGGGPTWSAERSRTGPWGGWPWRWCWPAWGSASIVVHASRDNFGNIPGRYQSDDPNAFLPGADAATQSSGDAGARTLCGSFIPASSVPGAGRPPIKPPGGYYLVASDGGIFTYGDAVFRGSRGGQPLAKPIVGMATTGGGYYLVGAARGSLL